MSDLLRDVGAATLAERSHSSKAAGITFGRKAAPTFG
jgi:hypothetical protein